MNLPTLYEYYTSDGITSGLSTINPYFTLNHLNITIYSGSMHYFRVPSAYWRDRLRKIRAAGLNTVETYVPWNLHEPKPGHYDFGKGGTDFEPMLDLEKFLKTAQQEDLFVIIRPGPYICAEWEFGGLPSWLLRNKNLLVRTNNRNFLWFVQRYFRALLSILTMLQFTRGGPIIAFQIENEYGSLQRNDQKYLKCLKRILRRRGIVELLFTADGPSVGNTGHMPNILSAANFQQQPELELAILKENQPGKPLMVMEYWTGWFDHWGESHNLIENVDYSYTLGVILQFPASVNLYMFHGGTNFGFMNGANLRYRHSGNEGFQPTTSSYDYDAPLSECGDYGSKYYSTKRLIRRYNKINTKLPMMPVIMNKKAYESIEVQEVLILENLLAQTTYRIKSQELLPMELLPINDNAGQSYGYIVYRKVNLYIPSNSLLLISGHVSDSVLVLINGVLKSGLLESPEDLFGFGYYRMSDPILRIDAEYFNATLDLVVENWGRVNYGTIEQMHSQYKGLWRGPVFINLNAIDDWLIYPLEFKKCWNIRLRNWQIFEENFEYGPKLYKAVLHVDQSEPIADTFIKTDGWNEGIFIVNGFVLSRYTKLGPQQSSYLPGSFLRHGANEILIFEHFKSNRYVHFSSKPVYHSDL